MKTRLFVYGSLRRHREHHGKMRAAEFLGEVRTREGYALCRQGRYPALFGDPGGGVVAGELYQVDDALLRELDAFEDVPALYQRGEVALADGTVAVAYVVPSERAASLERIEDGVWP